MAGKTISGPARLNVGQTLAEINQLQTNRALRDSRGLFFIEGVRNFIQAIENGFDLDRIIFSEKLLTAPFARKLVRQRRRAGIPTMSISPEEFRRVSRTKRASGVGRDRTAVLETAEKRIPGRWALLDLLGIRSPGNLGTLIRSSEAVGGAGFILIGNTIDLYSPLVVRPAMGGLFRQQFVRTSVRQLRQWIITHRVQVVGASPDGPTDFQVYNFPQATLLALGDERRGLSDRQRALCDQLVRIPMAGQANSLNLGVAGSLFLYEVYRSSRVDLRPSIAVSNSNRNESKN